jgi:hypothetical protein
VRRDDGQGTEVVEPGVGVHDQAAARLGRGLIRGERR